jgi:hypothetical protein
MWGVGADEEISGFSEAGEIIELLSEQPELSTVIRPSIFRGFHNSRAGFSPLNELVTLSHRENVFDTSCGERRRFALMDVVLEALDAVTSMLLRHVPDSATPGVAMNSRFGAYG